MFFLSGRQSFSTLLTSTSFQIPFLKKPLGSLYLFSLSASSKAKEDEEPKTRTKLSDNQLGGSQNSLLSDHSDVESIKSAASERAITQPPDTVSRAKN